MEDKDSDRERAWPPVKTGPGQTRLGVSTTSDADGVRRLAGTARRLAEYPGRLGCRLFGHCAPACRPAGKDAWPLRSPASRRASLPCDWRPLENRQGPRELLPAPAPAPLDAEPKGAATKTAPAPSFR